MGLKKRIISSIMLAAALILPGICATGCKEGAAGREKNINISGGENEGNVNDNINIAASIPLMDKAAGLYDVSDRMTFEGYTFIFGRQMSGAKIFAAFQNRDNGKIKAVTYSYAEDKITAGTEDIPVDILHEVCVSNDDRIIIIGSDDVVNADSDAFFSLKIFVYDKDLNKISEVKRGRRGSYESCAFNAEKSELYIMSGDAAGLEIFSADGVNAGGISGGEIANFGDEAVNMSIRGYIPETNHLAVQYDDGESHMREGYINMDTYELNKSDFYAGYGLYGNILAEYGEYNDDESKNLFVWRDAGAPRKKNIIYLEDTGEYSFKSIDAGGKYLFVNIYSADTMRQSFDIYDLKNFKMAGRIPESILSGDVTAYICSIDTTKSNIAMIVGRSDDRDRILLCDIGGMEYKDAASTVDVGTAGSGINGAADCDVEEKVAELEKKYGISIKTGMSVVRPFPDFTVAHVWDDRITLMALDRIETVLARCPEGFFKNFKYGDKAAGTDVDGIELYLAGKIVSYGYGVNNAAGFTTCAYGHKNIIVVDVNYNKTLEATFAHELSHIIDNRIEYYDAVKNNAGGYDRELASLNPGGYEYEYSYKVNGEDISSLNRPEYTFHDERAKNNPDIIYFASGYGKSYPTEDRAGMFEYLLGLGTDEKLPDFFESVNLRKKAELMFEKIRETFDLSGEQKPYWERWW